MNEKAKEKLINALQRYLEDEGKKIKENLLSQMRKECQFYDEIQKIYNDRDEDFQYFPDQLIVGIHDQIQELFEKEFTQKIQKAINLLEKEVI